jgi:uncharacterized phage protein gp47/JayE
MTYGLTDEGFVKKRLIDIKTEIETSLKTAFGENISLIPQSVFGQIVGIYSEREAIMWDLAEHVYLSQYPATAQGAQLSNVVQYNGIERLAATSSTATITLSGTPGTIVPAGTLFATSDTDERFASDEEVTIGVGGTIYVGVTAVNTGQIEAVAGTITVIVNPVLGLDSVTNALDATAGRDEETDAELRARRQLSTVAFGQNLVDSLFAQISNLDGVTAALVVDNKTSTTDSNGIPPHQFLTVVEGGTNADIAEAIWQNTPQGIASYGSITETITDVQGFLQDVKFSRPSEVDIYFAITVTKDATYPLDGDAQIKSKVAAYGESEFTISEDVILSRFYTPINEVPGITSIDIKIGLSASPSGTSNIAIALDEVSNFDTTFIEVTSS